jgi:uncharacterized protein (TIGR02246 family)
MLMMMGLFFGVALAGRLVPAEPAPRKTPPPAQHELGDAGSQARPDARATRRSAAPARDRSSDERAIRENIQTFIKAFNAKQAKPIAELFLPDGQVITEEGESVEGRDAIEEGFHDMFAESPRSAMEITVDSIRFIGSDMAVEVGSTKETPAPGETPEFGRYTVLHVKRDGKWQMAFARDSAGEPPTNHDRLQPLAWLVGEWIDDGGSAVVATTCRWSDDKNFLLQEMTLQISGRDAMRVTQRIGWDPLNKRIRSWVFDTQGGFGEGMWAHDGDSWIIKSTGVRPDGTSASATSSIVPTGTDGYVWRVKDRVSGDEVEPPLEVKVVRKPPVPGK